MRADPLVEAGGRLGGPGSEARPYCLKAFLRSFYSVALKCSKCSAHQKAVRNRVTPISRLVHTELCKMRLASMGWRGYAQVLSHGATADGSHRLPPFGENFLRPKLLRRCGCGFCDCGERRSHSLPAVHMHAFRRQMTVTHVSYDGARSWPQQG